MLQPTIHVTNHSELYPAVLNAVSKNAFNEMSEYYNLKACCYVTSQVKSLGFPVQYSWRKCKIIIAWLIILFLVAFKKVMLKLKEQLQIVLHLLLKLCAGFEIPSWHCTKGFLLYYQTHD